ncbi:hypothetical protein [Lactiplantibacillus plantarum]|uniref:hypothetical protein n=1 Tax=Lactiplantibacillus plantarum TaxID=1590 RepID=UPI001BA7FB79|nr:hypothetical protein [Lactiplantibacillus plantarum]MBS0954974.1 hypothetical protein [Lactiplantibacillus plantarum]
MNNDLELVYKKTSESDGTTNALAIYKKASQNLYYLTTMDSQGHMGPGVEMNQDTFSEMISQVFEVE